MPAYPYRGKFRTEVKLSGDEVAQFVSLKQRTKLHDHKSVTQHAILLAARLYQHKKDGGQIVLEHADGRREVLALL